MKLKETVINSVKYAYKRNQHTNNKGEIIMTELALENRIALLQSRQKDNGRIVQKLKRKLRVLQKNNTTK